MLRSSVVEITCCVYTKTIYHLSKRSLDLTGPFMLGGMLPSPVNVRIPYRHFTGCIKNVYIDHKFLDLSNPLYNNGTTAKCPEMRNYCASNPCKNGKCVNILGIYRCECRPGFGGRSCDTGVVFLFSFLCGVAGFVSKAGSHRGFG